MDIEEFPVYSDSEESVVQIEKSDTIKNQSKRKKPNSLRSKFYNYLTWTPDSKDPQTGKWKCNQKLCGKEYIIPNRGGTSSLKNHMERSHAQILRESGSSSLVTKNQSDLRSFWKEKEEVKKKGPITETGF
ncbi:unnamed protein product, partial [Allacma fusca]